MDARKLTVVRPAATIESFRPGDTVTVNVKIKEGDRERVQAFQGNVISGAYNVGDQPAPGANFIVRRISYGVGVERIFPVCSPMIESVKVVRKGDVRRARLYYLRGLTGRAARIKERRSLLGAGVAVAKPPSADMMTEATQDQSPAPEAAPQSDPAAPAVATAEPAAAAPASEKPAAAQ
jgi:large subunit ribosomal protein L19